MLLYEGLILMGLMVESHGLQRCAAGRRSSLVRYPARDIPIRMIGRFGSRRVSVSASDWLNGCAVLFISVGGGRIGCIRSAVCGRQSTDAAPVTGSLVFYDTFPRCHEYCTAEYTSSWSFCGTVCDYPSDQKLLIRRGELGVCKTMEGSIRFLVPDSRGVDQNFRDVTIVDMGAVPETKVSHTDLSLLCDKWPQGIFKHMSWRQQDLEIMHKDAKKRFHQTRPSPCRYCGKVIWCDMYWHMAKFHLDLAQLWRCPVSWCTMWKGTPQDCMDHLRGAHFVPWIAKTANIEKFIPPWTLRREMWIDSLRAEHSGILTDIMLFSDLGLSLAHQYRIHHSGLPHVAFCLDYMSRLLALLPEPLNSHQVTVPPLEEGADVAPRPTRRPTGACDDGSGW